MKRVTQIAALCLLAQLLIVFIGPPRALMVWLTGEDLTPPPAPRYVVVLGGSGMPSGSTLLRTWHAARFGTGLTNTTFIVALPTDGDPETTSVGRMRDELVLRGIPAEAIQMETRGLNTRQQAVNVMKLIGPENAGESLVIVTSGFHMRRSLLSFRKAGFTNVDGLYAYSVSPEADAGGQLWLRYGFWGNAMYEIEIGRELAALLVYKLRGWI